MDDRDADAIAEAATTDDAPLVTLKSEEQLDLQVLHRARERLIAARTGLTNQLRAVLLERGVILPKRRAPLRHRLHELMAGELPISPRVIRLLEDLRDEWASLDERIRAYDDELAALTRENQQARQLATIPGIGVISPLRLRPVSDDDVSNVPVEVRLLGCSVSNRARHPQVVSMCRSISRGWRSRCVASKAEKRRVGEPPSERRNSVMADGCRR